ncbi:unnamed protein product [Merluccius merluccius]
MDVKVQSLPGGAAITIHHIINKTSSGCSFPRPECHMITWNCIRKTEWTPEGCTFTFSAFFTPRTASKEPEPVARSVQMDMTCVGCGI